MRKISKTDIFMTIIALVLIIQTALFAIYKPIISVIFAAILLVIAVAFIIGRNSVKRRVKQLVFSAAISADDTNGLFTSTDIPIMVVSGGRILWCNSPFKVSVSGGKNLVGVLQDEIFDSATLETLTELKSCELVYNNKIFLVHSATQDQGTVYYFIDQTNLKKTATEYKLSRPVVAIVAVDSLDEVTHNMRDSERIKITSKIQNIIEHWFADAKGIITTLSNDRFLLVFDEKNLKIFEEAKFKILEDVRNHNFGDKINVTLSIGIGYKAGSARGCEDLAVQALDMALGRGGDQVVIKPKGADYRFYGGVNAATEKRARVRTRIIASALSELVSGSENVIIMGHKYSDLDCLGAAYALYGIINTLDRPVAIALNKNETLAKPLLEHIEENDPECRILNDEQAQSMVTKKTLVIIVDTHRPMFVDCQSVLEKAKNIVVIDHHRKSVDYIDNATVFYHETAASSACEMVTELLQYITSGNIGKLEADALLSGIMLDTKNFVLHTGVRTFEAAAFLRKSGADPVKVKKMFSGTMPLYKNRVRIASSAELFDDCAVAINEIEDGDTRIATSQAADELLNIDSVKASFVICKTADKYNISARSLGEINVQLIMEILGGGGHRTMAATQIEAESFDQAKEKLKEAINEYKQSR